MTTPVCAVCGTPCRPPFRPPPPEQAPDLDGRPGEPARSTLPRWVTTCRGCGTTAPDLTRPPHRAARTVETDTYKTLAGPAPERAFLRHAALCEAAGEPDGAAWSVLHAAWARDDAREDASSLRLRAASLWGKGDTVADALRVLDVLRRAGATAAARDQIAHLSTHPLMESDQALLHFQETLVAAGDTDRHLISSALYPPARTPHVTYGRTERRTFWQRVLRR